jgi:hypothetical protein
VTAEEKQRSSVNALSHGMLARCTLMRDESPEALEALLDEYVNRLVPAPPLGH